MTVYKIQFFTGSLIFKGYGFLSHSRCYFLYQNFLPFLLHKENSYSSFNTQTKWTLLYETSLSPQAESMTMYSVLPHCFPLSSYTDDHTHSSLKLLVFISVSPIVRTLRAGNLNLKIFATSVSHIALHVEGVNRKCKYFCRMNLVTNIRHCQCN